MSPPSPAPSPTPASAVKAGYWPAGRWATFPTSAINTSYFTHIYYAFVEPDPTTYRLNITQLDDQLLATFATTLRNKQPPTKALLSIGGGASNSIAFAKMANSAANRAAFIDSTIAVARNYGLDGLDLDWEFPRNQEEMNNLGTLFSEWRAALDKEAATTGRQRLLLTAAVYFAAKFILADNRIYPATSISENLDWVNAMCFDYRGAWDPSATGAPAALFDPKSRVSTSFGLKSWVDSGVPPKKVVMGLPLYGRTWKLRDPTVHGIGAPAVGAGPGNGVLIFSTLVDYIAKNNATVVYDGTTISAYSYTGTAWIGYDDVKSVTEKIDYAQGMGLAGYFFWALGYDKEWIISNQAWEAWKQ